MVTYAEQIARLDRTETFREKWGGVIHPDFARVTPNNPTGHGDLYSNDFVGTATSHDVINALINPQTQNRYVGSSSNLEQFLAERNWTAETAPTNWTAPEKQTVLRAEIAGLSQALVAPPAIRQDRPIFTHSVNVATREQPTVIEQPATQIVTEQVNTPDYELTRHSPSKLTDDSQPAQNNYLPLVAITIGAGVALSVIMKKTRGRKN